MAQITTRKPRRIHRFACVLRGRPGRELTHLTIRLPWDRLLADGPAGGEEYARSAGRRALGDLAFTALEKAPVVYSLVQPGDVVVDNDPIPVRTHEPMDVFSEASDSH